MSDRLSGMRVFAHVVEARSFSAAAAKLGISKSLASRQVTALEQSLSVKLLNRTTRRLSLTEAGALFYEHCARIVQEAALAEQRVTRTQSEPAGLVTLTAVPAFAVRHLLPAVAEFRRDYPKIRVSLSCSNRTLDPGDEGFDVAVRVARKLPQHLVGRKLAPNRAVVCAAPGYLEQHGTPRRIDDLGKHDCVMFPPLAPRGVWSLQRGRRKVAVKVTGSLEIDDMEAVRAAVVAGQGLGLLPLYMIDDALRSGQLVRLLAPVESAGLSAIYLVYLPNRTLSLRVRALIDFLVARFGAVPPWEHGV